MKPLYFFSSSWRLYLRIALLSLMCIYTPFLSSAATMVADTVTHPNLFIIPATKSYIEPWNNGDLGISHDPLWENREVSNWTSEKRSVVWYLYVAKNDYKIGLNAMLPNGNKSLFNLKVTAVEDPSFRSKNVKVKISGSGANELVALDQISFGKSGFYRFELKPISKTGSTFAALKSLEFAPKYQAKLADVHHTIWFSSPSAHLSFSPADGLKRSYDWMYGEILVPEGDDPINTFYMSLGYHRGYFGIQVNTEQERRVIFSVWDSANEAVDRNKVHKKDQVSLLGKGDQVFTGDFGNEGTGGHSHLKYAWESGKPVQFIMNAKKLPGNYVVYSAWFKAKESEGWKYIASWKAPAETRYFDGSYSFIENFGYKNGQYIRMAQYYNMWGRTAEQGEWVSFNRAQLTSTGVPGDRMDFAGGLTSLDSNRFYLRSGGYLAPVDNKVTISKKNQVPPQVDLESLINQVNAVVK